MATLTASVPPERAAARLIHDRYGPHCEAIERGCNRYPATAFAYSAESAINDLIVIEGRIDADRRLLAAGAGLVEEVRRRSPGLHDGPVVGFRERRGDTLLCGVGGYLGMLASCDLLRAEAEDAGGADPALPAREIAHTAAGGRPLESGLGRVAAVGVAIATTVPIENGRRAVVLGRRQPTLATDPGRWHVAPSGMLEPQGAETLIAAARRELTEELGVRVAEAELERALVPLGIGWDLLRLRPEVCLRLDLDRAPTRAGRAGGLLEAEEFETAKLLALDRESLRSFWPDHPAELLTPAACATLVLLESQL